MKKKKFLRTFCLLAVCGLVVTSTIKAQQFQKTYGGSNLELIWSMQPNADGGYIMTGYSSSFFGVSGTGMYLVRTNSYGDTIWTRAYTGTSSGLFAMQTADGGFIATGGTYSIGAGSQDGFFMRLDSNGAVQWAKTYGGTMNDEIICAQPAFDSGYILCGTTSSFGAGGFDVYVIRTRSNGDTMWTKTYGGPLEENASAIRKTFDSGYIISGQTKSFGAGQDDAFLLKIDKNGNFLWAKAIGGPEADVATSVAQTTDSGFIITGKTHSYGAVSNDGDVLLIRTKTNGDTMWTKTFGGGGTDWGRYVIQTADKGFAIAGDTWSFSAGENDIYVIKTDSTGMQEWANVYGDTVADNGIGIHQASDGGYVLGCFTENYGSGVTDYMLIKTDSFGYAPCIGTGTFTVFTDPVPPVASPVIAGQPTSTIITNATILYSRGSSTITYCGTLSAVQQKPGLSFLISPNPSHGNFTLTFTNTAFSGKVSVFDPLGRKAYEEQLQAQTSKEISLIGVAPGMYFVRVSNDKTSFTEKIMVQ